MRRYNHARKIEYFPFVVLSFGATCNIQNQSREAAHYHNFVKLEFGSNGLLMKSDTKYKYLNSIKVRFLEL